MDLAEIWNGIVSVLSDCWSGAMTVLPILGDICLFFITVYTFRLTVFPKKLKFIGFRQSFSAFGGDSFSITLENRSLCPVVVEEVDLVIDSNRIKVFRNSDDGECIIEGFKTATIKMQPYSEIISKGGSIKTDLMEMENLFLLVRTSRGMQRITYERFSKSRYLTSQKYQSNLKRTTVCRNTYNGKIVVPQAKYALSYVDGNGEMQTLFIHNSGAMSAAPYGYNGLPKELVDDENALRKHFEAEFSERNMSCHLQRVNDFGTVRGMNEDVMEE